MNDSIAEVAKVITKYFHNHGFLDVVASDIVAGIILVRTEQRTKRYHAWRDAAENARKNPMNYTDFDGEEIKSVGGRRRIATLPYGVLRDFEKDEVSANGSNVDHWHMMARCSVYATVIYHRIIPLNDSYWNTICNVCQRNPIHPTTSCMQLCCCCWIGSAPHDSVTGHVQENQPDYSTVDVHGLNFVGFNNIGVSSYAQDLAQTELVFISLRNDTIHKPFAIFVDHQEQYIVITIRGTLSIEDAITDVACEPVEMTEAGEKWGFSGRGRWAHSGMLRAALTMREEIEESSILYRIYEENIQQHRDVGLHQAILHPANRYANYKLVVTGHSLGAGTAVLLAILLRPRYPTLKCFGFGVPGSTMDILSCREVSEYATSVVMGNDIVSRLSYRSLCTFRGEILLSIARAKVNKTYIMQAMFRNMSSDKLMYARGEEPLSAFLQAYQIFQEGVQEQLNNPNMVEMFLPGRILHLVKSRIEWRWCSAMPHYALIKGKSEDYTDIAVSTTMISDHSPDFYHQEIYRLFNETRDITYHATSPNPL